jgi:hypothetical protein
LPVDHFLIERLTHHATRFSEPEPVSAAAQRRRRARGYVEPPDEDLIVNNRFGRPVLYSDFYQKWRKAVEQAGLPDRTRFHDLKHFYTTSLGGSGKHGPKTVQALSRRQILQDLGHLRPPTPRSGRGYCHRVRNRVLTHQHTGRPTTEWGNLCGSGIGRVLTPRFWLPQPDNFGHQQYEYRAAAATPYSPHRLADVSTTLKRSGTALARATEQARFEPAERHRFAVEHHWTIDELAGHVRSTSPASVCAREPRR